jgi:hypothetical protein
MAAVTSDVNDLLADNIGLGKASKTENDIFWVWWVSESVLWKITWRVKSC